MHNLECFSGLGHAIILALFVINHFTHKKKKTILFQHNFYKTKMVHINLNVNFFFTVTAVKKTHKSFVTNLN